MLSKASLRSFHDNIGRRSVDDLPAGSSTCRPRSGHCCSDLLQAEWR
jgi:hypothetical protein